MAWSHLLCAKLLSEPMLTYCKLDLRAKTLMKLQSKFKYFHWKQCIQNIVRKLAAILYRLQYVDIDYHANKLNANYYTGIRNKLPVYYPVTHIFKVSTATIYESTRVPFSEMEI